jgi:hypothetical protein
MIVGDWTAEAQLIVKKLSTSCRQNASETWWLHFIGGGDDEEASTKYWGHCRHGGIYIIQLRSLYTWCERSFAEQALWPGKEVQLLGRP